MVGFKIPRTGKSAVHYYAFIKVVLQIFTFKHAVPGKDAEYDGNFLQQIQDSESDDDNDFEGFEMDEIIGAGELLMELPMSDFEPGIDVELESDVHRGWTRKNGTPVVPPFTGISKLNVEMADTEPIDFLRPFLTMRYCI